MESRHEGFLRAEYDALRREIELKQKQRFSLAINAALISGALFAWLATNQVPGYARMIAFFAPALMLVLAWFHWILQRETERIAGYVLRLENELAPPGFGWERETPAQAFMPTRKWYSLWWLLMVIGSLAISVLLILR